MYIERAIKKRFKQALKPNKVLVLLGARRVGKTEFINHFLEEYEIELPKNSVKPLLLNGENTSVQESLLKRTPENYKSIIGEANLLVIDEAQNIPGIGSILKFIVDEIKGIKVIATGSSIFDLSNKLGEPLVGRKHTIYLYPFAQMEYSKNETHLETKEKLEQRLIFGNYPELIHLSGKHEKIQYLTELADSYLLKDILEFEGVRNAASIKKLLRLIAFQVGSEVSLNELSKSLGIHKNTVDRYLDLLSKVFIIYNQSGFSRNLRKEVTKMSRWYFYDNGIRNAIINNFNSLDFRDDTGLLWENYLLSERIKYQQNTGIRATNYFWRTYQQQEIDLVEEREGKLFAYEIKWKAGKNLKAPSAWSESYPDAPYNVITPENYLEWICPVNAE